MLRQGLHTSLFCVSMCLNVGSTVICNDKQKNKLQDLWDPQERHSAGYRQPVKPANRVSQSSAHVKKPLFWDLHNGGLGFFRNVLKFSTRL